MMKKVTMFVVFLLVSTLGVMAQQEGITFYNQQDEAYAIRIKYRGTGTATVSNAADRIVLTDDGNANSVVMTGAMSTWLGSIMDATNTAGKRNFMVDYLCSLSSDTLSNKLVTSAGVATDVSDGKWYSVCPIDASGNKSYDVARVGDSACTLTQIEGFVGGTGDVAVTVYVDGDAKWQKQFTSPVYIFDSMDGTMTNNITRAEDKVNVDEKLNISVGKNQRCHIRATRGTTLTTGGVGAVFTQR